LIKKTIQKQEENMKKIQKMKKKIKKIRKIRKNTKKITIFDFALINDHFLSNFFLYFLKKN